MHPTTRIGLVDDHPVFIKGVLMVLGAVPGLEVVAVADCARSALELARTTVLDMIMIDFALPDSSGISLTAQIRRMQPRCTIVGISAASDAAVVSGMLRAGASAYLHKDSSPEQIVATISELARSRRRVSRERSHDELGPMTPRECEAFELAIRGHAKSAIARCMKISTRTVEAHVTSVKAKLSIHSFVEMIASAVRYGAGRSPLQNPTQRGRLRRIGIARSGR